MYLDQVSDESNETMRRGRINRIDLRTCKFSVLGKFEFLLRAINFTLSVRFF